MRWLRCTFILEALWACAHSSSAFVQSGRPVAVRRGSHFAGAAVHPLPTASPSCRSQQPRGRGYRAVQMFDSTTLYELQNWASSVAATELTHVSPLSLGTLYGTGLLMAFSPCALSLLPLTIGYIAGTEGEEEEGGEGGGALLPSAAFAAGLSTVLSLLGLTATFAGRAFGAAGSLGGGVVGETLLPLAASGLAVAMGLNLLELLTLQLPSFEGGLDTIMTLPRTSRAFLLGSSSALVASPCCTPVLASILGFVASSQDPVLGLALLLAYSVGYTTPLLVAGAASGALSRLMSAAGLTWIAPASGAVLISYGTYGALETLYKFWPS